MPFPDIATPQASSQNHLIWLRPQSLYPCKLLSPPFTLCDDKRLLTKSELIHFPERLFAPQRSKLLIKAVATLEPKCSLHREDGHKSYNGTPLDANLDPLIVQADPEELEEKERLRRMRISKAKKGNIPWNKGKKHSAETLQRIRERTRLAMQNPKVRMKLNNLGHAHSEETRVKIGVGVRIGWRKRREKMIMQETCYFEWQNLIAEASRRGYAGEEELHWDSYKILSEKLALEWVEIVENRKSMAKPNCSNRALKSLEQRQKIAAATAAKRADPAYRDRVSRSHNVRPNRQLKLQRCKTPLYKDPLASSKLQMIKDIRTQRVAADIKKTEAIEQARWLIFETENATKALEAATTKSPIAQASLVEARKLLAEAIQLVESINAGHITSKDYDRDSSAKPSGLTSHFEKIINMDTGSSNQDELREVNRNKLVASIKDEDLNFSNLTLQSILIGEKKFLPANSSKYGLPQFNWQSPLNQSGVTGQFCELELNGNIIPERTPPNASEVEHLKEERPKLVTSYKKWVRGRLVEVTEEA